MSAAHWFDTFSEDCVGCGMPRVMTEMGIGGSCPVSPSRARALILDDDRARQKVVVHSLNVDGAERMRSSLVSAGYYPDVTMFETEATQ